MYHILMKRQIIRLFNDISNIQEGRRTLLNNWFQSLKLYRHGVEVWAKRYVSQTLFMVPCFCSGKSKK